MSQVTLFLERVEQGDPKAAHELLPLVYEELRRLVAHRMANEAAGQTLQPTALVHERLVALGRQRSSGEVPELRPLLRRRVRGHAPHSH
jgi:ECF sigma factor